jgi:hypothetical protein
MTAPKTISGQFYILSLKHSQGNFLTWWRPNKAGYCWSLDQAGIYDEATAKQVEDQTKHNGTRSNIAVSVEYAQSLSYRVVELCGQNLVNFGSTHEEREKAERI